MPSSAPRPLINALAGSIRAALNNASSNGGVGSGPSEGKTNAVFVNQSAFLRMGQAVLGIVQQAQSDPAIGPWGNYYSVQSIALGKSVLKLRQQSRGSDAQMVTLRAKKLAQWLDGWTVPAAFAAAFGAAITLLFNHIFDASIAQADAIQNSPATDVANVAAAQLLVSQGNV